MNQARQSLASAQLNTDAITPRLRPRFNPMTTRSCPTQSNLASLQQTEASSPGAYTYLPKVGDIISEDQPVTP